MENLQKTTTKNPQSFWGKVDAFFNRYYALFFAPILVGCLYATVLAMTGVAPFGDKYTAASYDLSAQICPFVEHLFDVFQGKSTLTYSYAIVGGADVTGTFLYFFVSPFSFLFLIFGDGKVAHASSIVMLCKLMTIAFAGAWFAKIQFKNIPDYICIVVGGGYAYCGYTFVSNTYINWMDFLIYMPFCAAAFRHFVKTGKFLPFSILVGCCIYTCFSIACFSLFTVFPALVAYGLICVEKERRNHFISYMVLSLVFAILFALPVLAPALGAYMRGARGGDLFENIWKGFEVSSEGVVGSFESSSDFVESYVQSLYRKWSYIISDSIFVVLTFFWFLRTGLKNKFAKFMLVAAVLTMLPLLVDESMNLLNMGSYMSYALRFGFLNALYFLGGACLALDTLCYDYHHAFDGKPLYADTAVKACKNAEETENDGGRDEVIEKKPSKKERKLRLEKRKIATYICKGLLVVLAVFAVLIIMLLCLNNGAKAFWGLFIKDEEVLKNINGFSARFAHSLGGAEVVVIPFVLVVVVTTVGGFMAALRKISIRFLSYILIAIVCMQVVFLNCHLVTGNASTQHIRVGNYQEISAILNERDDSYFRLKDCDDKLTACVPLSGDANSFSVFSSVIDKDNFAVFQIFGYLGNGKNSFKSGHNTGKNNRNEDFGDAFMGYKYFLCYVNPNGKTSVEKQLESVEKSKPYLKKVMVTNEKGEEEHLHRGDLYVYENTIVFPLGYRVSGEAYRFVSPNTNNSSNRKKNQLALYEYLRGKDLVEFTKKDYITSQTATELSEYIWDKAADVTVTAGQITARVTAEEGEHLLLSFVASKGYQATINGKPVELLDNDLKLLSVALEEGENVVVFTYKSPYVGYALVGFGGGLLAVVLLWLIMKKTKLIQHLEGVITWAGITVAITVVAFFMLYPTCVFIVKLLFLLL